MKTQRDFCFEDKFKALFRENFGSMCIFAERFLGDMEQARDVVYELFSQLWQHPDDISHVANIRQYTYAMVRNRCIDLLRRRTLHAQYVHQSQRELASDEAFFEVEIIREEVYTMLDKAIQNLPERSRQIILLKLEGYKNREIGEKLNITINTVNTLKSNTYKALREMLQNESIFFLLLFLIKHPHSFTTF